MEEIRRDPKGRKLRTGESYDDKAGRYRYQYQDAMGKRRSVYSYTLTKNDPVPQGRKQKKGESLREREHAVQDEVISGLDSAGGNQTVYTLMKRYIDLKWKDVRESTRNGYRTALHFMESDPMGKRKIKTVNATEAEEWLQALHDKQGKGYSTLHTLRGILRPAFAMAKRNRWTMDNPFDFPMLAKRYGGTKTRDAVSKADMRRFLDFLRTDRHFNRYFNGVYVLFNTGLRISEFCGLTADDIDFGTHVVHVRRQLIRIHDGDKMFYYIEEPKTENGTRFVPMLPDVEAVFHDVIDGRPELPEEQVVWNREHTESASGFLWLDKDGRIEVAQHWQNHLRWATAKFNKVYREPLPDITPHVCRHTFCSNCAAAGMNPKTLQTIMGHSSIEFTLNVYTHLEAGDAKAEFMRLAENYAVYPLSHAPVITAPDTDDGEEPDADMDEVPDDED